MTSTPADHIAAAIDEALQRAIPELDAHDRGAFEAFKQGTGPWLGRRDREALGRVRELASARELRLSAGQARTLVVSLVEARRIERGLRRGTIKKMLANVDAARETIVSFGHFIGDDPTLLTAFALVVGFISAKTEYFRALQPWLPRQTVATSARLVAAAYISDSVLRLTGRRNDRIVLDLCEAVLDASINPEILKRATGRRK